MTTAPSRPAPIRRPAAAPAATPATHRDQRLRTVQLGLFLAGAVLMPVGIAAIVIGWYGTAHSRYAYDQATYLISGGVLGLGLVLFGGFLYFGAWLAKVAHDQRESARQLADTMLVLAELISRQPASAGFGSAPHPMADPGAVPVLAGAGSTVHRRDCGLIAHREDLHELTGRESDLGACRVCRPALPGPYAR